MLRVLRRRQRGQGASVERALASNDAVALRLAVVEMVAARQLDHALHRLGAGIAEEHPVREAVLRKAPRQPLAIGNLVEVGDMPQLGRLLGERRDQMRMGVAERVDRDAGPFIGE